MGKVKKMPSLAFASLFKRNKGQNTVKEKRQRSHQINMLEGPLGKKILLFTLPLAGCSILQQLFNSTDVAVVGRFSSSQALAAVGSNGPLINMLVLLFTGLSVGANVLIARYIGQNDRKKVSEAVHTVITLSLICGFLLLILGQVIAAPLLRLMNTPDDVIELAATYLRIYFMGMPFVMLYNFGSAILRSVGDTSRPLYCLVISGIVNVLLNLFFVIVCDMSVAGVGVATVIADAISAGLVTHQKRGRVNQSQSKKTFIQEKTSHYDFENRCSCRYSGYGFLNFKCIHSDSRKRLRFTGGCRLIG